MPNVRGAKAARYNPLLRKSKQGRLAHSLFSSPAIDRREASQTVFEPDSSGFPKALAKAADEAR